MKTVKYILTDERGVTGEECPIVLPLGARFYHEYGLYEVKSDYSTCTSVQCEQVKSRTRLERDGEFSPFKVLNGWYGTGILYLLEGYGDWGKGTSGKGMIGTESMRMLLPIGTEFYCGSGHYRVIDYVTSKEDMEGYIKWQPEDGIGELTAVADLVRTRQELEQAEPLNQALNLPDTSI